MLWLKPDSSFCNCYIFSARCSSLENTLRSNLKSKVAKIAALLLLQSGLRESVMKQKCWSEFPIVFLGSYLISLLMLSQVICCVEVWSGGQVRVWGAHGNGAERRLTSGLLKGTIHQILSLSLSSLCVTSFLLKPWSCLLHIMHLPSGERVHLWRNKTAAPQTLQRSASVSCLWKENDHLVKEWSVQDHALRLPFLPLSSISNLNSLRLIVELFVWALFTCVQVFMRSPDVPAAAAFLQS